MKRLLSCLIFLTAAISCFAQTDTANGHVVTELAPGAIVMKPGFFGPRFVRDGQKLKNKELRTVLRDDPTSIDLYTQAKVIDAASFLLSFSGGIVLGYGIVETIRTNETKWTPILIGTGLLLIDIPISNDVNRKLRNSVDTYNRNTGKLSTGVRKELHFTVGTHGAGLLFKF